MRESQHNSGSGGGSSRGFTLLELIVAVGIAALLAVAVAGVFDSVGKTVGSGRRLSELNVYVAMIEQTMRRDFENMSRDGVLVIRNERTNDGTRPLRVALTDGDTTPRVRRIDEIMFFSRGRFTTQREALDPTRVATAGAARVYYGMGKRFADTNPTPPAAGAPPATNDFFRTPRLYEPNINPQAGVVDGLGENPGPGGRFKNPNRFASDWTLLRHVTLLAPPATTPGSHTAAFGILPTDPDKRLEDSDRQIALQPALSSVFGVLALQQRAAPSTSSQAVDNPVWYTALTAAGVTEPVGGVFPNSSSGLVDIATTDLSEVSTQVNPQFWSIDTGGTIEFILPQAMLTGRTPAQIRNERPPFLTLPAAAYRGWLIDDPDIQVNDYREVTESFVRPMAQVSHAWMLDAFPAESSLYRIGGAIQAGSATGASFLANPAKTRVRFEAEPPAMLGTLALPALTPSDRLRKAVALTDQAMLTRFNFVPRCTEFIVEWSLGEVYDVNYPNASKRGQQIWYGLRRENGVVVAGNPDVATIEGDKNEYGAELRELPEGAFPAEIAQVRREPGSALTDVSERARRERLAQMIHGIEARPGRSGADPFALESFFGQDIPVPDGLGGESTRWVWPRFVRVTMSFTSESDPEQEQTYQVVFPVPAS